MKTAIIISDTGDFSDYYLKDIGDVLELIELLEYIKDEFNR